MIKIKKSNKKRKAADNIDRIARLIDNGSLDPFKMNLDVLPEDILMACDFLDNDEPGTELQALTLLLYQKYSLTTTGRTLEEIDISVLAKALYDVAIYCSFERLKRTGRLKAYSPGKDPFKTKDYPPSWEMGDKFYGSYVDMYSLSVKQKINNEDKNQLMPFTESQADIEAEQRLGNGDLIENDLNSFLKGRGK